MATMANDPTNANEEGSGITDRPILKSDVRGEMFVVGAKLKLKPVELTKAFPLFPAGLPIALAPLVVPTKDRPVPVPTGATPSQYVPGVKLTFSPETVIVYPVNPNALNPFGV